MISFQHMCNFTLNMESLTVSCTQCAPKNAQHFVLQDDIFDQFELHTFTDISVVILKQYSATVWFWLHKMKVINHSVQYMPCVMHCN